MVSGCGEHSFCLHVNKSYPKTDGVPNLELGGPKALYLKVAGIVHMVESLDLLLPSCLWGSTVSDSSLPPVQPGAQKMHPCHEQQSSDH